MAKLALPGGFIDWGETWQEAIVREVFEETGIRIEPLEVREHRVRSAVPAIVLVFGVVPALHEVDFPAFVPTNETSERVVVNAPPPDIAFPLHDEVVRDFFRR